MACFGAVRAWGEVQCAFLGTPVAHDIRVIVCTNFGDGSPGVHELLPP